MPFYIPQNNYDYRNNIYGETKININYFYTIYPAIYKFYTILEYNFVDKRKYIYL